MPAGVDFAPRRTSSAVAPLTALESQGLRASNGPAAAARQLVAKSRQIRSPAVPESLIDCHFSPHSRTRDRDAVGRLNGSGNVSSAGAAVAGLLSGFVGIDAVVSGAKREGRPRWFCGLREGCAVANPNDTAKETPAIRVSAGACRCQRSFKRIHPARGSSIRNRPLRMRAPHPPGRRQDHPPRELRQRCAVLLVLFADFFLPAVGSPPGTSFARVKVSV